MEQLTARFEWEVIRDFPTLVSLMEKVEKIRTSLQRRRTHLAKQVICLDCLERFGEKRAIWVPTKTIRSCPRCSKCGKDLSFGKKNIPNICEKCDGDRCKSKRFKLAGRKDPFVEVYLPKFKQLEDELKSEIKNILKENPVWVNWGKYVKGIGQVTLGRILGHCDFSRLPTITKMWAHAGLGLDKEGKPQKRQKGKMADYDLQLQAATIILGRQLLKAKGKYYHYYLNQKKRFIQEGLSKAHAHNRAFRHMRKLALSHIWELARESLGLEKRVPYSIEYLGHTTIITPQDMIDIEPANTR
jgi:hypothetical protein